MMQQENWNAQERQEYDEGKSRALSYIHVNPQAQVFLKLTTQQPIFRIDADQFCLEYKLHQTSNHVHSQLLRNTKIRPIDREKLKSWMLSETQIAYERQTYALASKYLDLFFSKGYRIQRNAFQVFGIACLILATKVNERKMPNISFDVFDREQIFGFQQTLLKILQFKVTFPTYVPLLHLLLSFWDHYQTNRQGFNNINYFQKGVINIRRVRTIFETIECMDLVHRTLDISLDILVYNVFFLENRRFCLLQHNENRKDSTQADNWHPFATFYLEYMDGFLKTLKTSVPAFTNTFTKDKIIFFIFNFSRVNPKIYVNPNYLHFMYEATRQTYNPEISLLAQKYLLKEIS